MMAPDRTLTDQELWDLVNRHFGDLGPSVVQQMFQIAKRESGGNPDVHNLNPTTRDDSYGLFQINVRPDANPQYASRNLTDPETNAATAREMYDQSGLSPWHATAGGGVVGNPNNPFNPDGTLNPDYNPNYQNPQAESLPGLYWDPNTSKYHNSSTGALATQAEIKSALDQKYPDSSGQMTEYQRQQLAQNYFQFNNLSAAEQQSIGQRQYEFGNLSAYEQATLGGQAQDRAFAKEQWLFQQQNAIDQLQLERDKYSSQLVANARDYTLNLQTMQFNQDKFAFESSLALEQESRATQAQIFDQQAKVAGIQLEMASIKSNVDVNNAQMRNAVAMFNAGKEADVSMFNIDQQTKVAMFNAQGAFSASTFNAQMKFEVQKANVENERLRQQQLIDVAMKISEAAKDPGDRGKLAAMILALGSTAGFGASDAGLVNADLRTGDSLMPLEAMLRQREDILKSNPDPFAYEPVSFPQMAPPAPAVFHPATAAQAPAPDFSGVKVPAVNTTPFNPSSIPTKAPNVSPQNFDSSQQQFIANGQTSVPGEQLNTGGAPLTAEQRATIPDFALQYMIDQGIVPKMAGGGLFDGTGLFGGGQGNGWVAPGQHWDPQQFMQSVQQYTQNTGSGQGGGTPPQNPIRQTLQQYGSNSLPGMRQSDWQQQAGQQWGNGMNIFQELMQRLGDDPRYAGLRQAIQQVQQQMQNRGGGGQSPTGNPSIPQGEIPGQGSNWSGGMFPNWQPGQENSALGPNMNQWLAQRWGGGAGMDTTTTHPGYFPAAAEGGMMQSPGFIAGDSPDGGMQNAEMVIPLGPGMALVIPNKQMKKMMASGKKAGAKAPKKMATGGVADTGAGYNQGASMYENLLGGDTSTTRALNFLNEAARRAAINTPFDINHLPTPVFFSSPGMPSQVTDIGAALSAIKKGIQPAYFQQLVQQLRPAAYSEGVIGRTR